MQSMSSHEYCNHFLTWQCRIRQIAMRENDGRPSVGMRPSVFDKNDRQISDGITVLLIRKNPTESTGFLKFQVQKYNDPQDVYKKALTFLQSTHYQKALEFSDEMMALFANTSKVAKTVLKDGSCTLLFSQFGQTYSIPSRVRKTDIDEDCYQASLWHNRVFNPDQRPDITILAFQPDWKKAIDIKNRTANK